MHLAGKGGYDCLVSLLLCGFRTRNYCFVLPSTNNVLVKRIAGSLKRSWLLVIVVIVATAGCSYPSFYSHRFKGQVFDGKERPLADANVVNVVWRHCVTFNRPTIRNIRQESVRTDKNGRYSTRLSGFRKVELWPLVTCSRHSYETLICKFGYGSNIVKKPGKKITLGGPGEHQGGSQAYIDEPRDCYYDCTKFASRQIFHLWSGEPIAYRWVNAGSDCPYPHMPVVVIEKGNDWLIVIDRPGTDGQRIIEKEMRTAPMLKYARDYSLVEELTTIYVFALDAMSEPVGGISWSVNIKDGARVGEPLSMKPATREDWDRYRSVGLIMNP